MHSRFDLVRPWLTQGGIVLLGLGREGVISGEARIGMIGLLVLSVFLRTGRVVVVFFDGYWDGGELGWFLA